jgi:hypothetical protein
MSFSRLIRFETEDGEIKFADLGPWETSLPTKGTKIAAYASIDELSLDKNVTDVILAKVRMRRHNELSTRRLILRSFWHQCHLKAFLSTALV